MQALLRQSQGAAADGAAGTGGGGDHVARKSGGGAVKSEARMKRSLKTRAEHNLHAQSYKSANDEKQRSWKLLVCTLLPKSLKLLVCTLHPKSLKLTICIEHQ